MQTGIFADVLGGGRDDFRERAFPRKLTGPRLKPHVESYRHMYRGKIWYVFFDRAANRTFRVSGDGAEVIGALDGRRGLDEILAALATRAREDGSAAPDPAQLSHFVAQLDQLELLETGERPETKAIDARLRAARRRKWLNQLRSPMSFRIKLFDPTRLIDTLMPYLAWIFSPFGIALWLSVVIAGAVIGVMNWGVLTDEVVDRILSAENLTVAGLVYPIVKALHEFGHGLVLRHLGLEVREVGILIAAFIPTPYVDASSSITLERRRDRIFVASAGMAMEMFLGGVALMLWVGAEPGLLRAICYNVVFISGFNTLLFNGNPLQRYDGYYILSDAIGVPSLGARSGQMVAGMFRKIVMGERDVPMPGATPWERALFLLYGPASFLYRCGLMLVISFTVARRYPSIGLLLGAWTLFGYVSPVFVGLAKLARRDWGTGKFWRGGFGLGALVIGVALLLFVVPAPLGVVAQGVVAMPDDDEVRPGQAGNVAALLAHDGQRVRTGQPIMALEDRALQWRLARLRARVAEIRAQLDQAQAEDQAKAGILREQLAQARRQADDAERDIELLRVRSPSDGVLVLANEDDLPGRFAQKGENLATVWDASRAVVRVVVPLHDALMFRKQVRDVTIRPGWNVMRATRARILRIVPQASDILPSQALSLEGGGPFAGGRDQDHQYHTHEALFEVDVRAEEAWQVPFLNGRMHVRFSLPPEPAGFQIYRAVRLVFLRWLNA